MTRTLQLQPFNFQVTSTFPAAVGLPDAPVTRRPGGKEPEGQLETCPVLGPAFRTLSPAQRVRRPTGPVTSTRLLISGRAVSPTDNTPLGRYRRCDLVTVTDSES